MAQAKLGLITTNDTSKAEKSFDRITAAAKRANSEIKRDGVQVADEIGKKNQETFKAMLGRFAPVAAAVAGLSAVIRKVSEAFTKMAESGKQLRETADAIGVSAQTVGRLKAQADSAGVSAKDYAKALDELKSGATSIDELSAAWARVAKESRGAKEANAAFSEALRKNFEDIAQSKNIEKLNSAVNGAARWVASGLVSLVGADSNAETTIEYGLAKGIRDGRGKDAVIRRAIQSQTYSPAEGTVKWQARYAELEAFFDKRASEIDSERQASTDKRIASVYDKVGGNAQLTATALEKLGIKGLAAEDVEAAVRRNLERDPQKTEEKLIKDLLADQAKQKQAEDDKRIASVYEKLGGNAELAAKALAQLGMKGISASAVEEAVARSRGQEPRKDEENLIKDLLAKQAEQQQAEADKRISAVYDKLDGDAQLAANALAQLGMNGITAADVEAAVSRTLARDHSKADEKLIKDLVAEQTKQKQAQAKQQQEEAAREAKQRAREESIQKASIQYAYAQGGGLLAGINYGFMQDTKDTVAQDQLKQLTKQTASLTKMVEQLQKVNKALADD